MTGPVIALIGAPDWADRAAARLAEQACTTVRADGRDNLLDWLADAGAGLVLVDGDMPEWTAWIAAIKTDQATRRLPLAAVTSNPNAEQRALNAGADAVLRADPLDAAWARDARALIRLPDPAQIERLACQCQDELPPRARLGIEKFNAGEYYAQHDLFEALWMDEPGPVRDLYRAILQVGIAYYHITRGNHRGALRMLRRSVQWFSALPDVCQGVDVRQFQADSARVRAALQAIDPAEIAFFDRALLRPIVLVPSP